MLDRIARYFGYIPALPPIPLAPAQEDLHDAHRRDVKTFDYTKANAGRWFFHYSEGDRFFDALGRDDAPPIALICAALDRNNAIIIREITDGSGASEKAIRDWRRENDDLINAFVARLIDADRWRHSDDPDFPETPAEEIGYFFSYINRIASPDLDAHCFLLALSAAGAAFQESDAITEMLAAIHSAEDHYFSKVEDWFETRGVQIDRTEKTLKLPGYRALYAVSEPFDALD